MIDREKVIRGLGEILVYCHEQFGENDHDVQAQLTRMNQTAKDAIELLKAQEPRVTCSVCKYSRCLSGEWFCFMIGTSRYGKRVTDGDWYCKDAIGR